MQVAVKDFNPKKTLGRSSFIIVIKSATMQSDAFNHLRQKTSIGLGNVRVSNWN